MRILGPLMIGAAAASGALIVSLFIDPRPAPAHAAGGVVDSSSSDSCTLPMIDLRPALVVEAASGGAGSASARKSPLALEIVENELARRASPLAPLGLRSRAFTIVRVGARGGATSGLRFARARCRDLGLGAIRAASAGSDRSIPLVSDSFEWIVASRAVLDLDLDPAVTGELAELFAARLGGRLVAHEVGGEARRSIQRGLEQRFETSLANLVGERAAPSVVRWATARDAGDA